MQSVIFHIDSRAVIDYSLTLSKMHRSAMPVAIRGTLNRTALDVKTNTMPNESDVFTHRRQNFFKANSKVDFAKGFDVNIMRATVGFLENSGTQQQAVEDLQAQEDGGSIGGRTFVPLNSARVSNSISKMVRAQNRISQIRDKIVDSADSKGTGGQQYTRAALAAKKGGFVIGNKIVKGKKFLLRINSIHRKIKGEKGSGDTVVNATPIYSVQVGRHVHPKAKHFMRKAALESQRKMEGFYIEEAEKQFKRLMK